MHQRFDKIAQNSLELMAHENHYQSQAQLHLVGETEHQNQQLTQRCNKLKAKYLMAQENLEDRTKKITFMERYSKDLENQIRTL